MRAPRFLSLWVLALLFVEACVDAQRCNDLLSSFAKDGSAAAVRILTTENATAALSNRNVVSSILFLSSSGSSMEATRCVDAWQRAAEALNGVCILYAVDADAESGLAHEYGLTTFPSVVIHSPYKKNGFSPFQKEIGFESVVAALSAEVPSAVHPVRGDGEKSHHRHIEQFVRRQPGKPKIVLLSAEKDVALWYRAFSTEFQGKIMCAEGGADDLHLVDRFLGENVVKKVHQRIEFTKDDFPALFVHCGRGDLAHPVREWIRYDGEMGDKAEFAGYVTRYCKSKGVDIALD
jgi:hypothetical protein